MNTKTNVMTSPKVTLAALAIVTSGLLAIAVHAASTAKTDAAATSKPNSKEFDTPKQAADSLLQAAESFDVAALKEILGPGSEDIIASEDPAVINFGPVGRKTRNDFVGFIIGKLQRFAARGQHDEYL